MALCQYQISKAEAKDLVVKLDTLNVNQVFNLLRNNGATPNEAATLAGISVFEAGGGNPNAINPNAINDNARTQDFSVGLFQFNFRAGNFNPSNPMESTRGGYTPGDLLGNLNAQAQSAIALLRGSASGFHNWTTFDAYRIQIQNFANQLLGGANVTGGVTDVPVPETGTGTGQAGVQDYPALQIPGTTTVTGTVGSNPGKPSISNLNFNDTISHSLIQILLVLIGLVLLIGGFYLIGRNR